MKLQITAVGSHTLRFAGDLDLYTVDSARESLRQQLADKPAVELHLGGVDTCDTAGLQLLLATVRTASVSRKTVSFLSVAPSITTCGELLGLSPGALFANAR